MVESVRFDRQRHASLASRCGARRGGKLPRFPSGGGQERRPRSRAGPPNREYRHAVFRGIRGSADRRLLPAISRRKNSRLSSPDATRPKSRRAALCRAKHEGAPTGPQPAAPVRPARSLIDAELSLPPAAKFGREATRDRKWRPNRPRRRALSRAPRGACS